MFVNISTNRLSASTDVERTVQLQFFRQKFANPAIYDREIDLGKILGRFAFQVGGRAESSPPPEVKGITVTESAVGITLKGVNGAVAEIAFDSEMEPISAILNGKKVFPRK